MGEYSDLAVKCRGTTYNVHKAVVCSQSEFFAAACRWKGGGSSQTVKRRRGAGGRASSDLATDQDLEDEVRVVDLDDDDPVAVWAMVQYLYHLKFPNLTAKLIGKIWGTDEARTHEEAPDWAYDGGRLTPWGCLHQHAKIYSLAEKYGISSLKLFVIAEFAERVDVPVSRAPDEFIRCVREVYTGTPERDRGLRDLLRAALVDRMRVVETKAFQDFMLESPQLSLDLLLAFYKRKK